MWGGDAEGSMAAKGMEGTWHLHAVLHRAGKHRSDIGVLRGVVLEIAREDLPRQQRARHNNSKPNRATAATQSPAIDQRYAIRFARALMAPPGSMWICARSPSYLYSHVKRPAEKRSST